MLLILLCLMAPAPRNDAPRPIVLRGDYVLHWGHSRFDCTVDRDGCWECYSGTAKWIGGVEVDGKTVTLREAIYYPETGTTGSEATYRLRLGPDLAGQTDYGLPVRFERRLGPVE